MTPAAWATLAVVAVLCVVAGQVALGTWPTSASAGTTGCKDFFLISVRGSGELFGSKSQPRDAQDLSRSPETGAVRDGIDQALANAGKKLDYEVENVDYPATAVDPMVDAFKHLGAVVTASPPPFVPPGVAATIKVAQIAGAVAGVRGAIANYLAGEQTGEYWLSDVMNRLTQQCNAVGRRANFVLAGYSQGAMIVHNYLASNQGRTNIVGTVLVADPERTPNTGMHNYASAYNSDASSFGLCSVLRTLPPVPGRPSCLPNYAAIPAIPAGVRSSTVDVCVNNDIVCETSHDVDLAHPSDFGSIDAGHKIHVDCNFYCGSPTHLAGQDMGRRLLGAIASPSSPGTPVGTQGGGVTTSPAAGPAGRATNVVVPACPAPTVAGHIVRVSAYLEDAAGNDRGNIQGVATPGTSNVLLLSPSVRGAPFVDAPVGQDAPAGIYNIRASCFESTETSGAGAGYVKNFDPVPYDVTGPSPSVTATSTTAKTGDTLHFSGPSCSAPNGSPSVVPASQLDGEFFSLHVFGGSFFETRGVSHVKNDGSWTVDVPVTAQVPAGAYAFVANCYGDNILHQYFAPSPTVQIVK